MEEKKNYWDGALHFFNAEIRDYSGKISPTTIQGRTHFICYFRVKAGDVYVQMSTYQPTIERAESFMAHKGYVPNIHRAVYPDNQIRKENLFSFRGRSACWDVLPEDFKMRFFPVYFDKYGRDFFPFTPAGE